MPHNSFYFKKHIIKAAYVLLDPGSKKSRIFKISFKETLFALFQFKIAPFSWVQK